MKDRKIKAKNFGLRASDLTKALYNAARERNDGRLSKTEKTRLTAFGDYLKQECGLRDLRKVERSHVLAYGDKLKERYETESGSNFTISSAHDYLSTVNSVLEQARGDASLKVSPVRGAGMANRTGIAKTYKGLSEERFKQQIDSVSPCLKASLMLQRSFGLRFEESVKLDARAALASAKTSNHISIVVGSKGGRPREIKITSIEQIKALEYAASTQERDHYSLIPKSMTYSQYQNECYRKLGGGMHGNRHFYANDRYQQITGFETPVILGIKDKAYLDHVCKSTGKSKAEVEAIIKQAKETITNELGHSRLSVTRAYIG